MCGWRIVACRKSGRNACVQLKTFPLTSLTHAVPLFAFRYEQAEFIVYRKHDSTLFSNAISCMNCRISIDRRLRPDSCVSRHRLLFDIHADRLEPHLKWVAESVKPAMAAIVLLLRPIPHHCSAGALFIATERR